MSKNQSFDEQLKVISPCSESWEEMVGNDKVRFCSHCQKSVHNLSEMTKGEALNLALKSNGRLCVRYRMADQKIKFKDSKVVKPSNFSPLLKVAASGLFALTLSSGVSLAQSVIPTVDTSQLQTQTDKTQNLDPNSGSNIVTGTVVDPQGAVIAGARVSLKGSSIAELTTTTNETGTYYFQSIPAGEYTITALAEGFMRSEKFISFENGSSTNFDCTLDLEVSTSGGIMFSLSYGEQMLSYSELKQQKEYITPQILLDQTTKFFVALSEGDTKSVKKQLKKAVNVNSTYEYGETALMIPYIIAKQEMVKLLLDAKINVSLKSNFGTTALMTASVYADEKIVKMLLTAGANINDIDINGRTALMMAVAENKVEIVKLLLSSNANPNLQDKDNKTALSYAKEYNYEDLVTLLNFIGAKE